MRRADGGGRAAGVNTPHGMGGSWRGYGWILARIWDDIGEDMGGS